MMSFFRWFAIGSNPCRSLESFLELLVTTRVTWEILYLKYYDTRSYTNISAPCYSNKYCDASAHFSAANGDMNLIRKLFLYEAHEDSADKYRVTQVHCMHPLDSLSSSISFTYVSGVWLHTP